MAILIGAIMGNRIVEFVYRGNILHFTILDVLSIAAGAAGAYCIVNFVIP